MKKIRSLIYKNAIDTILWVLGIISLLLAFKSSTDPWPQFINSSILQNLFKTFPIGNQIILDVAIGTIVSLFFYILVVRIPAWQKKRRIKSHLLHRYDQLKGECINHFLWACNEPADLNLIDELKNPEKFKFFFKTEVSNNQDRWHKVLNGLNEQYVTYLVRELDMFRHEIEYALTSVDVADDENFRFIRNLNHILQRSRYWSNQEDQLKPLSHFMWSAFTGWSVINGYTGKDFIAEMIKSI